MTVTVTLFIHIPMSVARSTEPPSIAATHPPTNPAKSSIRRRHFAAGIVPSIPQRTRFNLLQRRFDDPLRHTPSHEKKSALQRPSLETPSPKSDSFRLYLDLHSLNPRIVSATRFRLHNRTDRI
ncbi:hypothetical protein VTL71DRAFT_16382 [Oculimacula yallundae]|uniref:Secreted protein n=1 Tax=Oculimacula yallundae TaxID=86028 RepID=A0ABR4CGH6_9HELO